ncbi:hypothetical protein N656DRAFT_750655 [Canariomyces notabilis]|uniref:Uncharacterized protein n=1 Tax=Canariomyces notabilis TaxID=2074819 RepID=A0AAN6TFY1_9PEZI|nr:hypothetical protein N656DRAFT_750655 [Canariomyces arenarius]
MATSPQAFYCLWRDEAVREKLFELLSKQDICALRLANSACCNLVTKRLFLRTNVTFTANSFTKESRIESLSRVGHHIEHLTFYFPHSNATFLPPLIHPQTGEEIMFLYSPPTSTAAGLSRPKYGNSELGEILTQQYSPLFHAATHVSSFISAMQQLPNLRHLTIKTPGQDPRERYRRDIVDYALISLRIAVERAPLFKLSKLSLSGVHPSAFNYLRHVPGFGASPSAALRWRQIRKLYISVESWDFYGPSPGLDHLKIIEDYIRAFAPRLDKFAFTWLGRRGPCPISLSGDPLFAPPRSAKKLFNEVTSPMSPLPPRPSRRPLFMPRVRTMAVRNATMNVEQLRGLITNHKGTVREFDFENVALIKGGSWDEALAPLTDGSSSDADAWSRRSMAVSSDNSRPGTATSGSGSAVASSVEDQQLPPSSAAAEAASRELFEVDLEGMVFGGVNDVDAFEAGVEEWARGVTAAAQNSSAAAAGSRPSTARSKAEEEGEGEDDGGLASDIEAAKQASQGFTTKLKKRRIRRRSPRHPDEYVAEEEHQAVCSPESQKSERYGGDDQHSHSHSHRHHGRIRHKHSRSSDDSSERHSSHSHRRRRHHRRHHSEEPAIPERVGTDNNNNNNNASSYRPETPRPTPKEPEMEISVPILNPDPLPVMLQPTVYDPSAKYRSIPADDYFHFHQPHPHDAADDGLLSSAQRSIEADLLAEAEEAAARSSALKRAREAVMTKLTREFSKRSNGNGGNGRRLKKENSNKTDSAAAAAASVSALHHYHHQLGMSLPHSTSHNLSCASSSNMSARLREGLFGRSLANVAALAAASSAAENTGRGMDSQTALVPLIFSRS